VAGDGAVVGVVVVGFRAGVRVVAVVGNCEVVRDGAVARVAGVVGVSVLVCNIHWPLAWPSRARDAVLSLHTDPLVTRLPISSVGINEIYPFCIPIWVWLCIVIR
jgi:hypothetical protein